MTRTRAHLVALVLILGAGPALGQTFTSGRPTIGDALRNLDRLRALKTGRRPLSAGDLEQTFVLPEHPGQNLVAWYAFDWFHYDVASPSGGKGGIRLYFYAREREIAERALPVIRNAYLRLVDQFHYSPTRQIPFILYASEREFQTTNVFEITEGTLGVTSPSDLKMSLPYFGNHELFREVCTHELAHQFAIQKLLDLSGGESSDFDALPLWFQEGLAEYYARGGLDPESDLFVRDLVWNPDPEHHYEVTSFEDDRYKGYIPTYKLGQARVEFIAEVYGRERVQAFLEAATLENHGFAAITQRALNEPLEQVDARWHAWLRQRYFPEYARTRQDLAQLNEIRDTPEEVEAFEVSPDGHLVFFRGIDREAGRVKLYLMDPRFPKEAVEVAADNEPGVESLHPIERSVLAVSSHALAFSAQSGPGDAVYLQPYEYRPAHREPKKPGAEEGKLRPPAIHLGLRRRLPLRHPSGRSFLEVSDLAFSRDGTELAFVGLTDAGQQDIYLVSTSGGTARQLTDDPFAKKDLAFGEDGLYFASDATDHGRFNLFRIDLVSKERTQLTTGDWNDGHPRPQADGSLFFSSTSPGKPDIYLLRDGAARRLTDFATGLSSPAMSTSGHGFFAGTFYQGRFRLVEVPPLAWLGEPPVEVAAARSPPFLAARTEFPQTVPSYSPYRLSNWRPEAGILFGGGGGGAVAGEAAALFADVLRDHLLYLDVAVYNSFDFTEGIAVFESREGRIPFDLGVYNWDWPTADVSDSNFSFNQREVGAFGTLRLPLDRFRRLEFELSGGAIERYCLTDTSVTLTTGASCGGVVSGQASAWEAQNSGVNPQFGPAVRYGYDTLRYDPFTGPLAGNSFWIELGGAYFPGRSAVNAYARLDAEQYWQIIGRARLSLRLALGASFAPNDVGRTWERTWWLSSADNLRGYSPSDTAYLIGTHYYVANAEFQFPLDPIIHLGFFEYLQGVLALDFGGVFDRMSSVPGATVSNTSLPPSDFGALDSRTLTGVIGVNFIFGPLVFRLHFGHPFDIGGIETPALQNGTSWVTNFTLRYLFF